MSNIVIYDPNGIVTNRVTSYLISVNTPDYDLVENKLVNPDASGLSSVLVKYWKVDDSSVIEMTTEEKAIIDESEPKPIIVPDIIGSMFFKGIASAGKFLELRAGLTSNISNFYCLENLNLFNIHVISESLATTTIGIYETGDLETVLVSISLDSESSKSLSCDVNFLSGDKIAVKVVSGQIINPLIDLYFKVRP